MLADRGTIIREWQQIQGFDTKVKKVDFGHFLISGEDVDNYIIIDKNGKCRLNVVSPTDTKARLFTVFYMKWCVEQSPTDWLSEKLSEAGFSSYSIGKNVDGGYEIQMQKNGTTTTYIVESESFIFGDTGTLRFLPTFSIQELHKIIKIMKKFKKRLGVHGGRS